MESTPNILHNLVEIVRYTWRVVTDTIKAVFRDPGVLIIFIVAGLIYPVLYNLIYWNNTLRDVPIAVVDRSGSPESIRFIRELDATADVQVLYRCTSMPEAERLMRAQKIHGILYFPPEYEDCIETAQAPAHISLYADMTSFLYYKTFYMAANMVMLDEMHNIQIDRYTRMGQDPNFAWALIQAAPYEEVKLYNEYDGYGDFLIPPVLILILHQTLLFGICMLRGTYYEEHKNIYSGNAHHFVHAILIAVGMGMAFLLIYLFLGTIDLIVIPRLFVMPSVGSPWDILQFMVPFLLSSIFFSITVSGFIHSRETGMLLLLSTSLIFLFISGVSWPQVSIPKAWRHLSYFFPSTWGIHGYLHICSMGANIADTAREFNALWYLTGVYFLTSVLGFYVTIKPKRKKESLSL